MKNASSRFFRRAELIIPMITLFVSIVYIYVANNSQIADQEQAVTSITRLVDEGENRMLSIANE